MVTKAGGAKKPSGLRHYFRKRIATKTKRFQAHPLGNLKTGYQPFNRPTQGAELVLTVPGPNLEKDQPGDEGLVKKPELLESPESSSLSAELIFA